MNRPVVDITTQGAGSLLPWDPLEQPSAKPKLRIVLECGHVLIRLDTWIGRNPNREIDCRRCDVQVEEAAA